MKEKSKNSFKKHALYSMVGYDSADCISFIDDHSFLWMVSASFKANNEVFTIPIQWIPKTWHLENYLVIWSRIPLVTFLRIQLF